MLTGTGNQALFGRRRRVLFQIFAAIAILSGSFGTGAIGLGAATGSSVRLLMVEEAGCRFCALWDAEVGSAYARSPEGRFAPLKRVGRDAPELEGLRPAPFTPTFIVLRNGEETGRITGYPGEIWFWQELADILVKIGFHSESVTGN